MSNLDPAPILMLGLGFWPSKVLLSAVELDLFTAIGESELSGEEIRIALGLHPRAVWDFLDTLVALTLLSRKGQGVESRYGNTLQTKTFLVRGSPEYVGGLLEMANDRLYRFWGDLTEGLRTGLPQNETKHGGRVVFDTLYENPAGLRQFMDAMAGLSAANFRRFATLFDFSRFNTLCDIGGAAAQLSIAVAKAHPHMRCVSFDLPVVQPIAQQAIETAGVSGQVTTASGDFFLDPFPKADLITMGMILHDWNREKKLALIQSAYEALPTGGALVAIENIIDDERRTNVFGLLMSLNMLIEFGDAFDFTGAEFQEWCRGIGFKRFEQITLTSAASAAIAIK